MNMVKQNDFDIDIEHEEAWDAYEAENREYPER